MDLRNGEMYRSEAVAAAAGVPAHARATVEPVQPELPRFVRVMTGPFRGRVYERKKAGGLTRRREFETSQPGHREAILRELQRQATGAAQTGAGHDSQSQRRVEGR